MFARVLDLTQKAWRYLLDGLADPLQLPRIAWLVTARGVHLGELLKLCRHRAWLRSAGIQTVLDVGANTGQFASAVRAWLPEARLYCFEPLPDCCEKLRRRLGRLGRFEVIGVAVGERRGRTEFSRNAFAKSSSILPLGESHKRAFPWAASVTREMVSLETLDALAEKLVLQPKVLLKIDVQGYELRVLEGARTVLPRVDYVLVETSFQLLYEGQASFDDVYNLLKPAGFAYVGNLEQLPSPIDGGILQADALFARSP